MAASVKKKGNCNRANVDISTPPAGSAPSPVVVLRVAVPFISFGGVRTRQSAYFCDFFEDAPSNHDDNGGLGRDDGFSIIVLDGFWRMDASPRRSTLRSRRCCFKCNQRAGIHNVFSNTQAGVELGDLVFFPCCCWKVAPPITPSELTRTTRGNDKK